MQKPGCFLMILSTIMLHGCMHQPPSNSHSGEVLRGDRDMDTEFALFQTCHPDVPLVLDAHARMITTTVEHGTEKVILGFNTRYSTYDDTRLFYMHHMELHGWQLVTECPSAAVRVLLFEKPGRRCIVSIQAQHKQPVPVQVTVAYATL